jgi:hypothetical protein
MNICATYTNNTSVFTFTVFENPTAVNYSQQLGNCIYPIPVNDELNITLGDMNHAKPIRVELFTNAGTCILNSVFTEPDFSICTRDLEPEIYLLRVDNRWMRIIKE